MIASAPIVVPFLKWAGGKRWLTSRYARLIPSQFDRYIEPFLGGAAVFFHVQPKSAVLSDANGDLINTYRQIRLDWRKVKRALSRHQIKHSENYYYEERDRNHRVPHEKAAQFIYLNRTCWNGLYRVNLRGEFNVPIGTKTNVLLDSDDFELTSKILARAKLLTSDFEVVLKSSGMNDFAFVDPPYVTRHNYNGFLKYNDKIFSWKDQERLARAVGEAADRGAKILLTNADHASVHRLYAGLGKLIHLNRNSVLAADSADRGAITELAVAINYEPGDDDVQDSGSDPE